MKYFNIKTSYGVETIDQLDAKDFTSYKDYSAELRRLKNEYKLAGMNVYISQRATKEWITKIIFNILLRKI
jgi:hypothetical protein